MIACDEHRGRHVEDCLRCDLKARDLTIENGRAYIKQLEGKLKAGDRSKCKVCRRAKKNGICEPCLIIKLQQEVEWLERKLEQAATYRQEFLDEHNKLKQDRDRLRDALEHCKNRSRLRDPRAREAPAAEPQDGKQLPVHGGNPAHRTSGK